MPKLVCENCGRPLRADTTSGKLITRDSFPNHYFAVITCKHRDCRQQYVTPISLADTVFGMRPAPAGVKL